MWKRKTPALKGMGGRGKKWRMMEEEDINGRRDIDGRRGGRWKKKRSMEEEEGNGTALRRWHQTIHRKIDVPNVVLVGQGQLLFGASQLVKAKTALHIHSRVRGWQHM